MTLTIRALVLATFVVLLIFSGGSRVRIFIGALCGAVIGGLLLTIADAVFGSLGSIGENILNAFT